ncbi:MAG: penicillin acylase family protein, partial [Planctomycetota bacterium]
KAQDWSSLKVGDVEVLILRDEFGVPHLKSPNASALFEAFGYVVAQDRLTQLELSRREARGELAEVFGPDMLPADMAARRESYTEDELARQFQSLNIEVRELIGTYTKGINRWREEAGRGDTLPLETRSAPRGGTLPEPWKVTDCLAVMIAAGRRFGEFGGKELENLEELKRLGKEEFDRRYPLNDPAAPTTIASLPPKDKTDVVEVFSPGMVGAGLEPARTNADKRAEAWVGLPKRLGSYAVLVAPQRSTSGKAMLLGCPQMGMDGPQPGYEIDLHGGGFDVAGMTFPGVPIVLIGRNADIAWTVTSGLSDNVDVFVEELNPEDPTRYLFQGKWLELEPREEVFKIKGGGTHRETFYRSVHGPVFFQKQGRAFSHKRTFWKEELQALGAFLCINRARNLEDLERAAKDVPLCYNLFCATATGEIGYWHTGVHRILPPGADPRLPLSGTGLEEWRGFIPQEWLPHRINPPGGLLVNWNNKPSRDWPNGDNMPWVGRHRVAKITSVVDKEKLSLEDLKAVPQRIESHGTYQQVVELGGEAVNVLPPGEDGTVGEGGVLHPHSSDQKALFEAWQYKPFHFLYDLAEQAPPLQ